MLLRTAKSCGPDAPTLASSSRSCVGPTGLRQDISADDGGKRARSPGRARHKPLKPLRAGMPGDSGVLVVARVRSTTIIAHETAGALGIRHSPRPLMFRRAGRSQQKLGRIAPRDRETVFDEYERAILSAVIPRGEHLAPFFLGAIDEGAPSAAADAGVGKTAIDPAECIERPCHRVLDGSGIA